MKYYIPILLQNKKIEVSLDEKIKIRKMTPREREAFFGIKTIDFKISNDVFHIIKITESKTDKGRYGFKGFLKQHIMDNTEFIFASNHIVECDVNNREEIYRITTDINTALNILKPTNTNCSIGFEDNESSTRFLDGYGDKSFIGGVLNLKKNDTSNIKIIYNKIKGLSKNERLKFDLYMEGLHTRTSKELKFISLVIALENIFLPNSNMELKFKFALRISQILNNKFKKDKKYLFELANKIYDARSEIVHSGSSKKLTSKIYEETIILVKASLIEFINYPGNFKEEYFKSLLIK